MQEPPGMMLALGIARNFGADHPGGVVVILCAVDPSDGAIIEKLYFKRAGRRAIVRARRRADANRRADVSHRIVHRAVPGLNRPSTPSLPAYALISRDTSRLRRR